VDYNNAAIELIHLVPL